jgi:hypothetical protein
MRVRDLAAEAIAGLVARPARVALTVLGTVIGIGALVATLGLSKTAGNQIVGHFDALSATDVVVSPSARAGGAGAAVLPWDAEARLRRLNGVAAAGTLSDVDVRGALVRSVPINDPLAAGAVQLPMKAASPGLFDAVHAVLKTGRYFDAGHSRRADRVLVLGATGSSLSTLAEIREAEAIDLLKTKAVEEEAGPPSFATQLKALTEIVPAGVSPGLLGDKIGELRALAANLRRPVADATTQ